MVLAPPKRPLTAFFLYKADIYETVKKEYPDKKMTELTKIISERWCKLDQETKARYEEKHNALKEKFERDKEAFEREHGRPQKKMSAKKES